MDREDLKPTEQRRHGRLYFLLMAALPALVPTVGIVVLFALHAFAFDGTCGPSAPDISAFPCEFKVYARSFFDGFSLLGLLLISGFLFISTSALLMVAWFVARFRSVR